MKITSLTLQAFRGFNKREEFCLESVDIVVLYGPNGHGKSSIYDAIEWGLQVEFIALMKHRLREEEHDSYEIYMQTVRINHS
ncbi:TPA: AAA family ATPase [Bacillus cereus]|nr:AAA family ATPase [Bacillus cereus]